MASRINFSKHISPDEVRRFYSQDITVRNERQHFHIASSKNKIFFYNEHILM
jgi:hypothetical protein